MNPDDISPWFNCRSVSEWREGRSIPGEAARAVGIAMSSKGLSFSDALWYCIQQEIVIPVDASSAIADVAGLHRLIDETGWHESSSREAEQTPVGPATTAADGSSAGLEAAVLGTLAPPEAPAVGDATVDAGVDDEDSFDAVREAAERGVMTMGGLPVHVTPGTYTTQIASDLFSEYKIYDFTIDWDGGDSFTFVLDEMSFDTAYEEWCHWEEASLLVAWSGSPFAGHMAALVDGVPNDDELDPTQRVWWHRVARVLLQTVMFPEKGQYLRGREEQTSEGEAGLCPDCGCNMTLDEPHAEECYFCTECQHMCPEGLMSYGAPCACCGGGDNPSPGFCCGEPV